LSKNPGKIFEGDWKDSCDEQNVYYFRVKDIFIPPEIPIQWRQKIKRRQNEFDNFVFGQGLLVPCELKSTQAKSVSFSESVIKENQIEQLLKASAYDDIFPGFVFNFRSAEKTYFVPIEEFIAYKDTVECKNDRVYKSKLNKSSIPIHICAEVGIEVKCEKKRIHWRYDVIGLVNDIKRLIK
jgi:penicillin-binding protein-related factor A (putative recombinase)